MTNFVNMLHAAYGMKGKLNNLVIQLRKNCYHPDLLESAFDGSYFYPPVEQLVEKCGKFRLLDRLLTKLFARKETNANSDAVVALAKEPQGKKIRPLWGTARLFHHPRFMHGAANSSELGVYAYSAAQVKKAMEVTHYLGGENYVFWGGREGYQSLLNTDMERELDHMVTQADVKLFFESICGEVQRLRLLGDFHHSTRIAFVEFIM